jgi:putative endonuclease
LSETLFIISGLGSSSFAKATDDLVYYVYILKSSKSGVLYYGYTTDLKKRLLEHNSGKSRFTKGHLPWTLVWYSAFKDQKKAEDFELYLKGGSGKAFVYKRLVNVALAKDAKGRNSVPKL